MSRVGRLLASGPIYVQARGWGLLGPDPMRRASRVRLWVDSALRRLGWFRLGLGQRDAQLARVERRPARGGAQTAGATGKVGRPSAHAGEGMRRRGVRDSRSVVTSATSADVTIVHRGTREGLVRLRSLPARYPSPSGDSEERSAFAGLLEWAVEGSNLQPWD
jgi:hypothetical protein